MMEYPFWMAIYIPIILAVAVQTQNSKRPLALMKRRRRERKMSNDMLLSCVNKLCTISTGSLGRLYSKVLVKEVLDNWVKVEKNGKYDLINSDYIQHIKILE